MLSSALRVFFRILPVWSCKFKPAAHKYYVHETTNMLPTFLGAKCQVRRPSGAPSRFAEKGSAVKILKDRWKRGRAHHELVERCQFLLPTGRRLGYNASVTTAFTLLKGKKHFFWLAFLQRFSSLEPSVVVRGINCFSGDVQDATWFALPRRSRNFGVSGWFCVGLKGFTEEEKTCWKSWRGDWRKRALRDILVQVGGTYTLREAFKWQLRSWIY